MFVENLLNWGIIEILIKFSGIWIHICVIISNLRITFSFYCLNKTLQILNIRGKKNLNQPKLMILGGFTHSF